jgi:hypothetical protein
MDDNIKQATELLQRWLSNSEFADVIRIKQIPSLREDTLKLLNQLQK